MLRNIKNRIFDNTTLDLHGIKHLNEIEKLKLENLRLSKLVKNG